MITKMKLLMTKFIYQLKLAGYFFTPPIFSWLNKKIRPKKKRLSEDDLPFLSLLHDLESKGIENFISADMVQRFCKEKKAQYFNYDTSEPHISDESLQKNLHELCNNGFTVIQDVLSAEELEGINKKVVPLAEEGIATLTELRSECNARTTSKVAKKEENGVTALHNLYDGISRYRGIESFSPSFKTIGMASDIHKICESYLGGTVSPSSVYLDVKGVLGASDSSRALHGDSFTKICKVFIALEDITDDNAPFLYFSGSHKQHKWRLFKDLLEFSNINAEYHDYFSMYNILSMFKVSEEDNGVDIKPIRVSLKAGDAIIADTSGIHGATDLISGRRLQLGLVFERRGFGAEDKYVAP